MCISVTVFASSVTKRILKESRAGMFDVLAVVDCVAYVDAFIKKTGQVSLTSRLEIEVGRAK